MKLTDLSPRWFAEPGRHGQGVTFTCPHCYYTDRGIRIAVAFTVPIDGGAAIALVPDVLYPTLWPRVDDGPRPVTVPPGVHWTRDGETFETLTITPSVDASRSGHWHGHITSGAIT